MRVGIVGAGIAGLACADGLRRRGHQVVLFDKGRGPGGRMSMRRMQTPAGQACFDHGAQYFTVRDARFADQVSRWLAAGVVAPWPAAGDGAYVGAPAMNSPIRDLAGRHTVQWATRVSGLQSRDDGWRLSTDAGDVHDVDLAVVAVPAEQAAALLADIAPDLATRAAAAISDPCWTVMLAFSEPVAVHADTWPDSRAGDGRPADSALGWAARNSAKPGRSGPESWVVQASPDWSRRHLDSDPDQVTADLIAALSAELGVALPGPIGLAVHLWRYARPAPSGPGVIVDRGRRLGLCGDWLIGPRVESAWVSGADLAQQIGTGQIGTARD